METKRRPGRPRKDLEPIVTISIGESYHEKLVSFAKSRRRTIREVSETAIDKYCVDTPAVDR